MMRLKIALRNTWRNRTRTLLSCTMIAGAATGIILFHGFADHLLMLTRNTTINNRFNHIQVAAQAYWDMAPGKRKDQLLPSPQNLMKEISRIPGVTMVSGRLSFFGLLSTGEDTRSAQGVGYDPQKETEFQKNLSILEGRTLDPYSTAEVIVGYGLQKKMNIKLGQSLTALGYTLDGVVNAADLTVVGIFRVGLQEVDSHVFMLPLQSVQQLLDTDYLENITIRLDQTEHTDSVLPLVQKTATNQNQLYQAKTWYDLSEMYRQTEAFFKAQNRVIEIILISLILSGIMNTVGMSVYERTGEIGTTRALGEKRRSIIIQFTLEGVILGVLGVASGFALGTVLSYAITSLEFHMSLPAASAPVPIGINRTLGAYLEAMAVGMIAAIVATYIPARQASKMTIVDALKKNI